MPGLSFGSVTRYDGELRCVAASNLTHFIHRAHSPRPWNRLSRAGLLYGYVSWEDDAARDDAFASAGISLQRCVALDCMQQQFVGLASAANTNSQPPVRTRIKLGHSSSSYTIGASLQKQMPFIFNKLREITINWSDCK